MAPKAASIGKRFLETAVADFQRSKRMADRAFEQLDDRDFHARIGDNTNSIYVIAKHISGNLMSRWTDFLTSDGEKPVRNRDAEFVEEAASKADIVATWERGWGRLFETLSTLTEASLDKTVTIRGEEYSVMAAIVRAATHVSYHVGQILMLARHMKGDSWKWITIPPGKPEQFYRRPPQ